MARNSSLIQLAKLYGIESSYLDMRKRRVHAPEESILLALGAMGADIRGGADPARALRMRLEEAAESPDPVIVAWDGRIDQRKVRASQKAALVLEGGKTEEWPSSTPLPPGYHRLITTHSGRIQETLLISAPVKAHFPITGPVWGIFAPVYALHSRRSYGAGDLADFESLIDWMRGLGGRVAATLPLLSAFLDHPIDPSPYSPASRLYWNEFYIDLERVPELAASPEAQRLAASKPARTRLVNYRETMAAKRQGLEALARSFFATGEGTRQNQFRDFLQKEAGVSDYARFRAVADRQQSGWRQWPDRLREGDLRPGDCAENHVRYHLYAQWVIQDQLAKLAGRTRQSGGMLYLDLPLGIHADSYDTWRHRNLFVKGFAGGAPPDPVFTSGQNWAFPPMHPQAMRAERYQYLIAYIRNHLRYASLLRIDHVMGFHRLFWIPEGCEGDQGLYVRYPADEMYAILSLESHRHGAGIIGENLGLVPAEVDRAIARHNVRGLYIAQVEAAVRLRNGRLPAPLAGCVASLNTHDMFPFKAFLEGGDITEGAALRFLKSTEAAAAQKKRRQTREALAKFVSSGRSPEKILEGSLDFLAKSRAGVVLVNLEDLWQETEPQNIPATITERPNWRRRMRYSMERLRREEKMARVLRKIDKARGSPLPGSLGKLRHT